ncbi:MAG TPA: type IV pilus twitching motility protein PilT [Pyrinomonadaceae bacterium]|nr:type IV pilus twitching motility protein PilT [Pyrinomonadaceae bacterium]
MEQYDKEPDVKLHELLKKLIELNGSDLHLTTGTPPQVRIDGELRPLDGYPPLGRDDTQRLVYSVLSDAQKQKFQDDLELDLSFGIVNVSRFRLNVFDGRGGIGAVFRAIPFEVKSFDELGLPPVVEKLCRKPRGLVLVTGPTGSGKSTTLAAMIDKINRERRAHIITIEDPIEFLHSHKNCIVNQREVRVNTHGFANALRTALRQDPDVVLIGELRDLETVESALRIAETGHLTFATLHTNTAASTITRVIDIFPANQQAQIRTQLSMVLEGVLCQQLLPITEGPGRAMALEILLPTPAVRNLIREDKVHQLPGLMTTGQDEHQMQTLNQSLARLYNAGRISFDAAMQCSADISDLKDLIGSSEAGVTPLHLPGNSRPLTSRLSL